MIKNNDNSGRPPQFIILTDKSVTMMVKPHSFYRLVRVLNHWIKHLIEHYPPGVHSRINSDAEWLVKWNTLYKIMRSSNREFKEMYQVWTNDYNEKDPTPQDLFEFFLIDIPMLRMSYDIQPIDKDDSNPRKYFQITLDLYFFKDENNAYGEAASLPQYRPFTDNNSLVTWTTNFSMNSESQADQQEENISQKKNAKESSTNIGEIPPTINLKSEMEQEAHGNSAPSPSSGDTNLSHDSVSKDGSKRDIKNAKKTKELQAAVSQACSQSIEKVSENMMGYVDKLQDVMLEQTKILQQMYITQQVTQPVPQHVPSMSTSQRMSNMPSPKHTVNNQRQSSTGYGGQRQSSQPFQRSGIVTFSHNGQQYDLNDTHFHKYSRDLLVVSTKHDLIQFYVQLQSMAVMDNIFLTPFDALTSWNKISDTIPTTCMLTTLNAADNTIEAYKRMKSAIYTKVASATISNAEYEAIVAHHATTQDGFEVMYDLAVHCHPKLAKSTSKVRDTNPRPTMKPSDSIYSFVKSIETWREIDSISGITHSVEQVLDIVMEELRADTRYEVACAGIMSRITMNETYNSQFGTTAFPHELLLTNLPGTVMSYYTDEEKSSFFPSKNKAQMNVATTPPRSNTTTHQLCESIINRIQSDQSMARESVDVLCKGCGKFGHDVYQSGCDFCAQLLIARNFLQENPKSAGKILRKYRQHQRIRQDHRKSRQSNNSDKKKRVRFSNKNRAKVKQVTDLLDTIFDTSDEEHREEDEFEDAESTSHQSESTEEE